MIAQSIRDDQVLIEAMKSYWAILWILSLLSANCLGELAEQSGSCNSNSGGDSSPNVVEKHIDSPSRLTALQHYVDQWTHSNQFHLYPHFMTSMPIDIAETSEKYIIHVDLPGVEKDNIRVVISPSQHEMQISAYKKSFNEEHDRHYKRIERHTGHMTRTLYLPDGASLELLSAEFRHGVLEVTLPKQSPNPAFLARREIEIQ